MNYRLFAIDVDGTLQNSQHQLTDTTADAIRHAVSKGVHIVLTTGKQYVTIQPHIDLLGLKSPQITAGGAIITDPKSSEDIYRKDIPPDLAQQILSRAHELGITAIIFRDGQTFTREMNADIEYMLTYDDPYPTFLEDITLALEPAPVQIMCIAYQNDTLYESAYQVFLTEFGDVVEVRKSSPYYIEFTALGVSKGTALKWLTEYLGISLDHVVAIGDSYNDLSMFDIVGLSVAMANAPEAVRKTADIVTLSHDEDGVAHIIQELL
ncbi:MAG: hypothetical protein CUN55_07910 [Phototrophicales bacterium]|nr:MAG: hypothetical protein CUN55_07910 [Phototrophicales bacterium]